MLEYEQGGRDGVPEPYWRQKPVDTRCNCSLRQWAQTVEGQQSSAWSVARLEGSQPGCRNANHVPNRKEKKGSDAG